MRGAALEDREILDCIHALVAQQRRLRDLRDHDPASEGFEHQRLTEIEENLDQMWDLLRRRRALRARGLDPDLAGERPQVQITAYVDQ
jgi:hypothetical protein